MTNLILLLAVAVSSHARPVLEKFPAEMRYSHQETSAAQLGKIRDRVYSLSQKLGIMGVDAEKFRPHVNVDMMAVSDDGTKFIFGVAGAATKAKFLDKLYSTDKVWVYNTVIEGEPVALAFHNLNTREVEGFLTEIKAGKAASAIAPEKFGSAHLVSLIFLVLGDPAYAAETAVGGKPLEDQSSQPGRPAISDSDLTLVAQSFVGCGKGLGEAALDVALLPDKLIRYTLWGAQNPKKFWDNEVDSAKAMWQMAKDFVTSMGASAWNAYKKIPTAERSQLNCRVGTPILMGMYGRAASLSTTNQVNANRVAKNAMDDAVKQSVIDVAAVERVDFLGKAVKDLSLGARHDVVMIERGFANQTAAVKKMIFESIQRGEGIPNPHRAEFVKSLRLKTSNNLYDLEYLGFKPSVSGGNTTFSNPNINAQITLPSPQAGSILRQFTADEVDGIKRVLLDGGKFSIN